ncbi:Hypothetical predicted protein, partial [Pelobates cultripes]
ILGKAGSSDVNPTDSTTGKCAKQQEPRRAWVSSGHNNPTSIGAAKFRPTWAAGHSGYSQKATTAMVEARHPQAA